MRKKLVHFSHDRQKTGEKSMKIEILTLFPEVVTPYLEASILGRAREAGVEMHAVALRDFASGKHRVTDDTPFGGGAGMVMMVEPIHKAIESLRGKNTHVILTSASAKLFTQEDAKRDR